MAGDLNYGSPLIANCKDGLLTMHERIAKRGAARALEGERALPRQRAGQTLQELPVGVGAREGRAGPVVHGVGRWAAGHLARGADSGGGVGVERRGT